MSGEGRIRFRQWLKSPFMLFFLFTLIIFVGLLTVFALREERFTRPSTLITAENVDQLELIAHFGIFSADLRNRWDTSIRFSQDSRILSLSMIDGLKVWDVDAGHEIFQVKEAGVCAENRCENLGRKNWPPPNSHAAALSPRGDLIALGIARGDVNNLRVWNIESGDLIRSFGPDSGLQALAFSPDGSHLFYTSQDESSECIGLCAWHIPSGEILRVGDADTNQEVSVQLEFTSDGGKLIYSTPEGINVFNLETREQHQLLANPYPVISMDTPPDDSKLAVMNGTWGRTFDRFSLWDVESGEKLYEPLHGFGESVMQVAFSPSGEILVTSSNGSSRVWDVSTGTELHQMEFSSIWFDLSPDGQFTASKMGQSISISNPLSGDQVAVLESETYYVGNAVAFSPDGTMLVTSEGEVWGVP